MRHLIALFILSTFLICSCEREDVPAPDLTDPTVATLATTNIQLNAAKSGFNITNPDNVDITERGIVWSTDSLPVTSLATRLFTTIDTASFEFDITGLVCGTRYYVRAYAITNTNEVIYGNQTVFHTLDGTSTYINKLLLSKTGFIDTIITNNITVEKVPPFIYTQTVYIRNRLILPEGVYMYLKVDSSYLTTRCYSGGYSRELVAGDTMHIPYYVTAPASPSPFYAQATMVSIAQGLYIYSRAKVSVHIAGIANTPATTYSCLYKWDFITTNTTSAYDYLTTDTPCNTPCVFQ